MSKWFPPRLQPTPKPRNKIPGRNPPEPVERRPEPTPAPPLCKACHRPAELLGMFDGEYVYGHKARSCEDYHLQQLVATLERIPCMSEDCDGPEHHVPDARDGLPNTRCHRCAAVRLAKSVLTS